MGFIDSIITKFFGKKSDRDLKAVTPMVDEINAEFRKLNQLSNDEFRQVGQDLRKKVLDAFSGEENKIKELKETVETLEIDKREPVYNQIDKLETDIKEKIEQALKDVLPKTFALVKETARRFKENAEIEVTANDFDKDLAAVKSNVEIQGENAIYYNKWLAGGNEVTWDMLHYDVQLIGGMFLHEGKIAEMATGEGKTLVATLPVFLNALSGKGVHVVTVNDYLAKRDAEWMAPIFNFHGLSVDCIDKHSPNSNDRRKAYNADITYGTNNEYGFDYLRDNMALNPEELVQRKHNYAIVDEVDSVLIDDARTPLIISGPVPKGDDQMFEQFRPKVARLIEAQKKLVSELFLKAKRLIAEGNKDDKGGFHLLQAFKGLPKTKAIIKFLSEQGTKTMMQKTENVYLAENAKRMPEVTQDLYFVIEEQHKSVDLTDKGLDFLTSDLEDNEFFILPDIGSKIAEIEKDDALSTQDKLVKKEEILGDFSIKSERVHTVQQLLKSYTLFEKDIDYVVMDGKVKIVDEQTGRILEGRRYSDGLHQAIESKEKVKVEAATQTFATVTLQNYFRMYNKLSGMTGTAETEAGEFWDIYKLDVVVTPTNRPIVRNDAHDLVFRTRKEKYSAVIDEVQKLVEAKRPVLIGTTSVDISELLGRTLKMRGIKHNVLNAKHHQREAEIVAVAGKEGGVTIATNMAGRGTDIKLSKEVKEAGGLAIIATERHESRRVDNQLRGRAGRQGDAGSSQFFVSLEDELMRLFGSGKISSIMDKLGLKEGEVIQHSMISKSIQRAQKKVEENNFGIRKRLLEYDDVMNQQREVVYKQRRHALYGERLGVDILNMLYDTCDSIVNDCHGQVDFEDFNLELIRHLAIESPVTNQDFTLLKAEELTEKVYQKAFESFKRKTDIIVEQAMPVIQNVFEESSQIYKNIVIPITDGKKVYSIAVNLERAVTNGAKEILKEYQKAIVLVSIDEAWKEHLREMDELKQSVQNASYEQKDPLLIYKLESFNLFRRMLDKNNKNIISTLMKGRIFIQEEEQVREAKRQEQDYSKYETQKTDAGSSLNRGSEQQNQEQQEEKREPVRVEKKINRNSPCPCGSGKKYKNCHGRMENE